MAQDKELHSQIKLMISSSTDRKAPSFGRGAAILLHGVDENGSLNKTAKNLHMAYSKAWSMIKKVEEGLGFQLIDRFGARGSKLTEDGARFLKLYDEYEAKVQDYAEKEFEEIFKEF
jgi:molybdate transport system regulatory protein